LIGVNYRSCRRNGRYDSGNDIVIVLAATAKSMREIDRKRAVRRSIDRH
jgi:hypothetical protein